MESLVPREQLENKVYLDVTAQSVSRENKVLLVHLERLEHQVCLDLLVCPDKKERVDLVVILAHQEHKDLQDQRVDVVLLDHKV